MVKESYLFWRRCRLIRTWGFGLQGAEQACGVSSGCGCGSMQGNAEEVEATSRTFEASRPEASISTNSGGQEFLAISED